jgi:hypothetical protein
MVAEKVPAAMCSLIGTAKLNGLDPESYALSGVKLRDSRLTP